MRVTKEKAAANRKALLEAASRLFRKRGIDAVGVADIAREAGLTHGALYAHFPSKDALAAEAFSYGFAGNMADVHAWARKNRPRFDAFVEGYLSPAMRDRLETGCPMAASASEISRHDEAVGESFTRAFEEMASLLESSLDTATPAADRRRLAIAAVAANIGALAVSRAVAKTDPRLADDVLDAVRETLLAAENAEPSAA